MNTMEFTLTVSPCMGCAMCPQEKLAAAYTDKKRRFAIDDFLRVLTALPLDTRVDFSGYSEPFLHPLAHEFISEACFRGHKVHIYTTLVGLTEVGAAKLAKLPIEFIRLHTPDLKEFKYDSTRWLKQFALFQETHLPFTVMAMGEVAPVIRQVVEMSGHKIELPTMLSRAGNLGWLAANRPIKGKVNCAMSRYHSNVVLPNGDVWGCCMTYGGEIRLGNLLHESYQTIYDRAEDWAKDKNPPDDSPCRACCWAEPA